MISNEKLLEFQTKLNYVFNDISLLKLALTHKSYAYEDQGKISDEYNERIEFLGDAILEHIISDFLYNKKPKLSEGQMTKKRASIVCETALSNAMKRLNGQNYILLGKCEKATGGRLKDAILADAFESVIGAIYLDGGFDIVNDIVLNLLSVEIENTLEGKDITEDYKTKLQEILQKNGSVKIEYILKGESGPEHNKIFEVELLFNGKIIGKGIGKSKKHAEQEAAKYAIENM